MPRANYRLSIKEIVEMKRQANAARQIKIENPTDIKLYWQMYHQLPEVPVPENDELKEKMQEIMAAVEQLKRPIKSNLVRHAYLMATLGLCPWVKSETCPCEPVLAGEPCKRKLIEDAQG